MKLKLTHTHPQPDTHHITQSPPPRPILGPAVQVLPQTSAVTRFIVSLYLPPPLLLLFADVEKLNNRSLFSPRPKKQYNCCLFSAIFPF